MKRFVKCVFPALLFVAGCASLAPQGDALLESVRTYDEGLRWGRYSAAASRVPAREREAFLDERDELAKDLHITDYDLVKVGARRGDHATIEVKYSWFKETEGTLRETRATQQWERHGASWMLVDERRSHGPEMPGLREPATPLDRDADADADADHDAHPDADHAGAIGLTEGTAEALPPVDSSEPRVQP